DPSSLHTVTSRGLLILRIKRTHQQYHQNEYEVTTGPTKNPKFEQWQQQLCEGTMELPNMGLEEIPQSIFDYGQHLKIMHLQDNNLRSLPKNFFDDLPNLAWCDLRFNGIQTLPEFTKIHNSLRVLMLQDNQLINLPYSMGTNATKLKTLGLRGNPLHDPPPEIVEAGVDAIRTYLIRTLEKESRIANQSKENDSPRHGKKSSRSDCRPKAYSFSLSPELSGREKAPDFTQSLYNSVIKLRKSHDNKSRSSKSQNAFSFMNSKMAAKIKYTNDVWRDVPFDGTDQREIINKSLEDMRNNVMRKFSIQRDKLLQRIRDREVLQKWRFETKCLQKAGRRPGSCCLVNPPFGVSSDVVQDDQPRHLENFKFINLSPEDFQREVSSCTQKLQEFVSHPVPLTDSASALIRLQEVEEIHRKLCSIKLGGQNPTPH
ncbi:unnamed protein product, partial [Allacma fusca]